MTPVKQTVFRFPNGDCFRACVATILDLPIEDVPNFADAAANPVRRGIEWLRERGYTCLRIDWEGEPYRKQQYIRAYSEQTLYCIVGGESARSPREDGKKLYHAVVGYANGWGFELVHDPHPDNTFLKGDPDFVLWLFKTRDAASTH